MIKELEPFAQIGVDEKYAELLTDNGIFRMMRLQDYQSAKVDFQRSILFYPSTPENYFFLTELNLKTGDAKAAYQSAKQLVSLKSDRCKELMQLLVDETFKLNDKSLTIDFLDLYSTWFGADKWLSLKRRQALLVSDK